MNCNNCLKAKPPIPYDFTGTVSIGTTTPDTEVNVVFIQPNGTKAEKQYLSATDGLIEISLPECLEPSSFFQGCYKIEIYDESYQPLLIADANENEVDCLLIEISSDCDNSEQSIIFTYVPDRPCGCLEPCGCLSCGH